MPEIPKQAVAFLKKSAAKDFFDAGRRERHEQGPEINKNFLRHFFLKKRPLNA